MKANALKLDTGRYFAHAGAIIAMLDYAADHTRLLSDAMLDVADDCVDISKDIEGAAQKLGEYIGRVLVLRGGVTDEDFAEYVQQHGHEVPSLERLAEILAIVEKDEARKPKGGWHLSI
jgi:hypothetical protein